MPCCSQNPEDRFSPYKIYNIKNDARKPVLGGGGGGGGGGVDTHFYRRIPCFYYKT